MICELTANRAEWKQGRIDNLYSTYAEYAGMSTLPENISQKGTSAYAGVFLLQGETGKALLLAPYDERKIDLEIGKEEWVPRSQVVDVEFTAAYINGFKVVYVTMSNWIAGKKGWL